MAKQKFTKNDIELIKHFGAYGHTHDFISKLMNCSRAHITRIINGKRWGEVPPPHHARGEELYYRFLQHGTTIPND
jgi:hypothetical protein